jgi:arylsulfatase A-like enzyme
MLQRQVPGSRYRKSLVAVVALLVVAQSCAGPSEPPAAPPNILFILADDLGYGDLGCYGQQQIQTPHLDRVAAEGMRFLDHYAGSTVCAPSRCVLMTGRHTGNAFLRGNSRRALPASEITVAEVLQAQGYRTALVGKWGLGEEGSEGVPRQQGFDEFFGYLNQRHAHNYYPEYLWRDAERVPLSNVVPKADKVGAGMASEKNQYSHDLFVEEALAFLERNQKGPFFLYLALTIPHANNEAGRAGMEVPDVGPYADRDWPEPQKGMAAMVTRMDHGIGQVLERLQALGMDERTVVFFTSDNGPHREGGNDPEFFQSSGGLRGIKRDLYEGGIRVPLLVRWPGQIKAGSLTSAPSSFADFLPTAASLAGATLSHTMDGTNLAPTLRGQRQDLENRVLYWEFHERGFVQAVRRGTFKAILRTRPEPGFELFQLDEDAGENRECSEQFPEIAAELTAAIDASRSPSEHWPGQ